MRRGITGILDVPSTGVFPALSVCGASVFLGGAAGCVLVSCVGGGGGTQLSAYLQMFLTAAREGQTAPPSLLPLIWNTIRWPLLTLLLGFTALGVLGLPVLFAVRGFLLCFSISSFVLMYGNAGSLLAFVIFGISSCTAIPVLFILGVQSMFSACRLAGRSGPGGGRSTGFERQHAVRCGVCAGALCVSVLLEYLVVPALTADLAAVFLA